MQLMNIHKGNLIPIVIAGSVASSFPFKYDAIDFSNSPKELTNNNTISFLQNAESHYYTDLSIKSFFEEKLMAWKRNTMFFSFAEQVVSEQNFKDIVLLGERVVPFILDEISKEPSTLVWALNFIYNKKISNNPNTTIEQACRLWLERTM